VIACDKAFKPARAAGRVALAALCALGLAGCLLEKTSEDPNAWYNKTVMEHITGRSSDESPDGPAKLAQQPAPVPESELYRSEASCGGGLGSGRVGVAAPSEIALEMTECEVARRIGAPDRVELRADERGERVLALTYARGERPRIYRFAGGRLTGIDALAVPASPRTRVAKPAPQH
jgi:hypothetical protein